jgi:hypothetical protein
MTGPYAGTTWTIDARKVQIIVTDHLLRGFLRRGSNLPKWRDREI